MKKALVYLVYLDFLRIFKVFQGRLISRPCRHFHGERSKADTTSVHQIWRKIGIDGVFPLAGYENAAKRVVNAGDFGFAAA